MQIVEDLKEKRDYLMQHEGDAHIYYQHFLYHPTLPYRR
jgi:hypothetical protein